MYQPKRGEFASNIYIPSPLHRMKRSLVKNLFLRARTKKTLMLSIQYILPTLGNVGNIILFFNSISFQVL
ncbi:hypothetical protein BWP07_06850 [Bacteroides fragilis]|nr:hypothetical protein BWP07_06850 [Bacteroides fragilis]